jgi:hypothetical protein
MHKLTRQLALGLAVPLVVAAPVVLLSTPAHASPVTPTINVTSSANPSVYGQEVRLTAHVFDGEVTNPVMAGTVEFVVDGVDQGAPVPLNASGIAISVPLFDEGNQPLSVASGSGSHFVIAHFVPTDPLLYNETDTQGNPLLQGVEPTSSSVAVQPTATTLVADVAGAFPGGVQANSVKPGGAVEFKVNGTVVGSNDLVNGTATVNHALPAGPQTVTATYTGDTQYLPSSGSATRKDPTLDARVLAKFPKSKSGWYRSAVRIWFICKPAGSELVDGCPNDTVLKQSDKGQTVTRSVRAVDGGVATITVSGIDIDRNAPQINVEGRSCKATDKLSGVKGKCHMKIGPRGHYRAIAIDKAGNRAVERGSV